MEHTIYTLDTISDEIKDEFDEMISNYTKFKIVVEMPLNGTNIRLSIDESSLYLNGTLLCTTEEFIKHTENKIEK